MEDQFSKYLRLFGNIFFSAIGFIVLLVLLMFGLRLLFGVLDFMPWFSYLYKTLILLVPTCFFVSVFSIFFYRTKMHPSKAVRWISKGVFLSVILLWMIVLVLDCKTFFKAGSAQIDQYNSFNLLFLVCNVGIIFLFGVIQALTTEKEVDWMEKHREERVEKV